MSERSWSTERVTALRELWVAGQSASQIAKALGGVTRNAVIGKIHRLGVAARPAASPPAGLGPPPPRTRRLRTASGPRIASRVVAKPPPLPPTHASALVRPRVALVDAVARVFDLAALSTRGCHWPVGDPQRAGFGYCGGSAPGKSTYCLEHHRLAYRPPGARFGPGGGVGRPGAGAGRPGKGPGGA